jgi:hypothetical protein
MSREVTEAHYLHERSGLEAVLRPPVKQPTALAWVPRKEELVAATRDGELVSVDPILGTRVLAEGVGETAVLDLHDDGKRFLIVTREGKWRIGNLRTGEVLFEDRHAFLGGMNAFFLKEYVILVGDEGEERFLYIYTTAGERKGRARVPEKVVPLVGPDEKLLLARSTPAGLSVIPFPAGRFPKDLPSTVHRLRPSTVHVLGFTTTGICVWGQEGGQPQSMRLPDLTAGDISKDGAYLGLGTRNGAVALARVDRIDKRVRPDLVRAFNGPVTSVAFSSRGRWLATGAEGLRIWSWED